MMAICHSELMVPRHDDMRGRAALGVPINARLRIYPFATVNSLQHPVMGVLGVGMRSRLGDERLRLGAFKVMTDGSSSGPTAATCESYTSNAQDCGILY